MRIVEVYKEIQEQEMNIVSFLGYPITKTAKKRKLKEQLIIKRPVR